MIWIDASSVIARMADKGFFRKVSFSGKEHSPVSGDNLPHPKSASIASGSCNCSLPTPASIGRNVNSFDQLFVKLLQ